MSRIENSEMILGYSGYKRAIDRFDQKTKRVRDIEEANSVPCGLLNDCPQKDIDRDAIENSVYIQNIIEHAKFSDHEKAVVEGIMTGLTPKQIAQINHFNERQYISVKTSINRKLVTKIERDIDLYLNWDSDDIRLHRTLENFPVSRKNNSYEYDRKTDIEKFGDESVYNLIPEYFPINKTALITETFKTCRKYLKGKELTKTTLLEINEFLLKRKDIINVKQQALISKMHGMIYKERE